MFKWVQVGCEKEYYVLLCIVKVERFFEPHSSLPFRTINVKNVFWNYKELLIFHLDQVQSDKVLLFS
jgi:predicted ATP-dependent serine protease